MLIEDALRIPGMDLVKAIETVLDIGDEGGEVAVAIMDPDAGVAQLNALKGGAR